MTALYIMGGVILLLGFGWYSMMEYRHRRFQRNMKVGDSVSYYDGEIRVHGKIDFIDGTHVRVWSTLEDQLVMLDRTSVYPRLCYKYKNRP